MNQPLTKDQITTMISDIDRLLERGRMSPGIRQLIATLQDLSKAVDKMNGRPLSDPGLVKVTAEIGAYLGALGKKHDYAEDHLNALGSIEEKLESLAERFDKAASRPINTKTSVSMQEPVWLKDALTRMDMTDLKEALKEKKTTPEIEKEEEVAYQTQVTQGTNGDIYAGKAPSGARDSDPAWQIKRTRMVAGTIESKFAGGTTSMIHVWTNREELDY